MKITLNIEKRYVYLIVGVLLAVLGFLVVYAYNSGGPASFVGHTWDEIVCDNNMCVDTSTGRVGIGTTTPSTEVHIKSSSGNPLIIESPRETSISLFGNGANTFSAIYLSAPSSTLDQTQNSWAIGYKQGTYNLDFVACSHGTCAQKAYITTSGDVCNAAGKCLSSAGGGGSTPISHGLYGWCRMTYYDGLEEYVCDGARSPAYCAETGKQKYGTKETKCNCPTGYSPVNTGLYAHTTTIYWYSCYKN